MSDLQQGGYYAISYLDNSSRYFWNPIDIRFFAFFTIVSGKKISKKDSLSLSEAAQKKIGININSSPYLRVKQVRAAVLFVESVQSQLTMSFCGVINRLQNARGNHGCINV